MKQHQIVSDLNQIQTSITQTMYSTNLIFHNQPMEQKMGVQKPHLRLKNTLYC